MLKPTREIWKFLKEHLVTRKPEKHKFLTILKKNNWLNFARENTKDTRERISSRVSVA
jgi:predicted RNA-binding protein